MKTLVTGASGYIGLHLVSALLQQGHQVTALVRAKEKLGPLLAHARLTAVEADLEDHQRYEAALAGHQCCVHAALVWGDEARELEGLDAVITAKLAEAIGKAGVQRAIYLSSLAVHRGSQGMVTEDQAFTTRELYGATKAAGELFLRAACARHGTSCVVVRPGPVVGRPAFEGGALRSPRQLEALIERAQSGAPLIIQAQSKAQLSDVHTLAKTIVALTQAPCPEDAYLCVGAAAILWEDIARYIITATGSDSELRLEPPAAPLPSVHFKTDRLAALLGEQPDSRAALFEHIDHLIHSKRCAEQAKAQP